MIKRTLVVLASSFAVAGSAGAHPDHLGPNGPGLLHLVTDPYHVGLMVLAVALAFGLRRALRRRAR